jgi:hypothetical protein
MLQQGSHPFKSKAKGIMRRLEPAASPLWLDESSTLARDDCVSSCRTSEIRHLEFASMRHRSQVYD